MACEEEGPQYPLQVIWGSEVSPDSLAIPVPVDYIVARGSIELDELAANALHRVPLELEEYHQRVAAALDALELRPASQLEARGPEEGNFYIVLPE